MRLVRIIAACVLAVIALVPVTGSAAQNEFDLDLSELRHGWVAPQKKQNQQQPAPASLEIDLKELRKIAPPLPAKPKRSTHNTTPAAAADTAVADGSGHESIHVVRPGEHLFLILMKQYGLSNQAAERLIPEIMRLNGVTSPKALKVGQRLRIPLPYKNGTKTATPVASEADVKLPAPTAAELPASITAADIPAPPAATEPVSLPPAPDCASIRQAPPCTLAQELLEKLGLLVQSTISIQGVETVSAASAGRNIHVACGLSEAELYTYGRLLERNNRRLLSLDKDASADCVVEKLANQLGLVFRKLDNASDPTLQTYFFEPFGVWPHGLQLTVLPTPVTPSP